MFGGTCNRGRMAFIHIAVGNRVVAGGGEAMITHVVSADQVIVRDLTTGAVQQVPVRTLRPAPAPQPHRRPDLSLVSDEDWAVAQVRCAAITVSAGAHWNFRRFTGQLDSRSSLVRTWA